jgi:hypothetical protein
MPPPPFCPFSAILGQAFALDLGYYGVPSAELSCPAGLPRAFNSAGRETGDRAIRDRLLLTMHGLFDG